MNEELKNNQPDKKKISAAMGRGIAIGVAIGAGLGVAMHNIAVGMGAGIAIGAGFQKKEMDEANKK